MNPKIKKIKIGESTYDIVSTQNIQKVETFNDIPNEELSLYKYASSDGATSSPIVEVLAEYHAGGDSNTFSVTSTANNNQVSVTSFYSHFDPTLSNFMTVTEATNAYTLNYALPITGIRLGTGKAAGKLAFNLKSDCTISVRKYFGFNGSTNTITSYDSMSKVIVDGSTEYQFTADDTPVLIELAAGDHTIESYFESSAGRIIITQFAFSGEAYYSYTKKHLARQEDLDQVNSTLTAATEELNTKVTTNIKAIEQNKQEITALKANNDFIKIIDVTNLPKASINHLKTLYRCDNELYQCISQGEGTNKEFVFNLSGTSEITSTVLDNVYTEIAKDFSDYFEISYLTKVFRNNGSIKLGSSNTQGEIRFDIVNNLPLLDAVIKVRAYNSKKSCFYFEISTNATDYSSTILIEDAINDTTISLKNLLPEDIDLSTETITYISIATNSSYIEDGETITVDPRGIITSINATFGDVSYKWEAITSKQISITWADLKNLRDNGKLIPGQEYRIIDYVTTTSQDDTKSAMHRFDIIVKALDSYRLSENAKAAEAITSTKLFTNPTWLPNITKDDVQVLYKISVDDEDAYISPVELAEPESVIYTATDINSYGIEVPVFIDPDPNTPVRWSNKLVSVKYAMYEDETFYEDWVMHKKADVFVELGYEDQVPILFKTDPTNADVDGIADVDYSDMFKYIDDFEVDNVSYNRWEKFEIGEDSGELESTGIYVLTNVIVVNNQFTITQEELQAALTQDEYVPVEHDVKYYYSGEYILDDEVYDLWLEAPGTFGRLTNKVVDCGTEYTEIQSKDTYFSYTRLEAWELKYCLDNNTELFSWASSAGKGVIYYLKDEFNNECYYDFKNILFNVSDLGNDWYYTFGGKLDKSILESEINIRPIFIDNSIGADIAHSGYMSIPINVFNWTDDGSFRGNKIGNNCTGNIFKGNCSFNTLGKGCSYNIFGYSCSNNIFGNDCSENNFGQNCSSNVFDNECTRNVFKDKCCYNNFENFCSNNDFLQSCSYNSFKVGCCSNYFYDNCSNNFFESSCSFNRFGKYCAANTFGASSENNRFGEYCEYNTFLSNCNSNNFGNYCSRNTFLGSCNSNNFGESNTNFLDYYRWITLEANVSCLNIVSADNVASNANYAQNIIIHSGVSGSSSSAKLTITIPDRNLEYTIDYYKSGSTEILL